MGRRATASLLIRRQTIRRQTTGKRVTGRRTMGRRTMGRRVTGNLVTVNPDKVSPVMVRPAMVRRTMGKFSPPVTQATPIRLLSPLRIRPRELAIPQPPTRLAVTRERAKCRSLPPLIPRAPILPPAIQLRRLRLLPDRTPRPAMARRTTLAPEFQPPPRHPCLCPSCRHRRERPPVLRFRRAFRRRPSPVRRTFPKSQVPRRVPRPDRLRPPHALHQSERRLPWLSLRPQWLRPQWLGPQSLRPQWHLRQHLRSQFHRPL